MIYPLGQPKAGWEKRRKYPVRRPEYTSRSELEDKLSQLETKKPRT
jgi:hypothetical protein